MIVGNHIGRLRELSNAIDSFLPALKFALVVEIVVAVIATVGIGTLIDKPVLVVAAVQAHVADRPVLGQSLAPTNHVTAGVHPVQSTSDWTRVRTNVRVGQTTTLEVEREGEHLQPILKFTRRPPQDWATPVGQTTLIILLSQFLYLGVAFFMAFSRPADLVACIGALLLACGSATLILPDGLDAIWRQLPNVIQLLLWVAISITSFGLGFLFTFFALFPRSSFRSPILWALAWMPLLALGPFELRYVFLAIYRPDNPVRAPNWVIKAPAICWATYLPVSFVLFILKYFRLPDPNERRRVRVFIAGLVLVISVPLPILVCNAVGTGTTPFCHFFLSQPIIVVGAALTLVFPLSFAYAILRHRIFDIRVIVRQSLQYAAARNLLLWAAPFSVLVFLCDLFVHRNEPLRKIVADRAWIYVCVVVIALWFHSRRGQWLHALDRRFFREQYKAHEILRATLQCVRTADSLQDIAPDVVTHIEAALHPLACAILSRGTSEGSYESIAVSPTSACAMDLPGRSQLSEIVKVLSRPIEVGIDRNSWVAAQLSPAEMQLIRDRNLDLLVPVAGRRHDVGALIALAKKRSEEPYTLEDKQLLEGIATALALLPSELQASKKESTACMECPLCGRCYDPSLATCVGDESVLVKSSVPRYLQDRLRMDRRIGSGGMGRVYEATDTQLHRRVAIKVISECLRSQKHATERFLREAHALASFQHPNVVTLFDAGVTSDGCAFLVMELLVGGTLRQELNSKGRLQVAEATGVLREVCAAIGAAHRRSIIHRDLKPENIFLARNESVRIIKVLDFGLAKLVTGSSESTVSTSLITEPGKIVGTPLYMAPELLTGKPAEKQSDLWSLAVITYEILTGHHPFIDLSAAGGEQMHESSSRLRIGCQRPPIR